MALVTNQKVSEAKVIDAVKGLLPELLTEPGTAIDITACDPEQHGGALFTVTKTRRFVCRKKS